MIYEVVYVNESGKKYSKVLLPEQNGIQKSVYKLRSFYDKNKN